MEGKASEGNEKRPVVDVASTSGIEQALATEWGQKVGRPALESYASHVRPLSLPAFWSRPHPMGLISIPLGPKVSHGIDFPDAVRLVKRLYELRSLPGFDHFLAGWRNGPQVPDSISELRCLEFLTAQPMSRGVKLGPFVNGSGGRRADFLWETTNASFFVECKSMAVHASRLSAGLSRISETAAQILDPFKGKRRTRLDVVSNGTGGQFAADLRQATLAQERALAQDVPFEPESVGFVTMTAVPRTEAPRSVGPALMQLVVQVGDTATQLSHENAFLTVTYPIQKALRRYAKARLDDARRQLHGAPHPGIIYLEARHVDVAAECAEGLLGQPAYAGTPLVMVSDGAQMKFVYRQQRPPDSNTLDSIINVLPINVDGGKVRDISAR